MVWIDAVFALSLRGLMKNFCLWGKILEKSAEIFICFVGFRCLIFGVNRIIPLAPVFLCNAVFRGDERLGKSEKEKDVQRRVIGRKTGQEKFFDVVR